EAEAEVGAPVLSLEKSLEVGVRHSRIYQTQKEQVFLQALALSLARHQYVPIPFARGRSGYEVTTERATEVVVDPITQQPKVQLSDNLVEQHRISGSAALGFSWLLKTGGQFATAFTTDFLRYLTGDPRTFTSSQVGATLVQPLWRGA